MEEGTSGHRLLLDRQDPDHRDGRTLGGLNWGRGSVSVGLTILIVGLVGYLSVTRLDVDDEAELRRVGIRA